MCGIFSIINNNPVNVEYDAVIRENFTVGSKRGPESHTILENLLNKIENIFSSKDLQIPYSNSGIRHSSEGIRTIMSAPSGFASRLALIGKE